MAISVQDEEGVRIQDQNINMKQIGIEVWLFLKDSHIATQGISGFEQKVLGGGRWNIAGRNEMGQVLGILGENHMWIPWTKNTWGWEVSYDNQGNLQIVELFTCCNY